MPIYVYEREDGTTFDTMQKVSDEVLTVCPDTGQKVKRLICAPTPIFKGSGFYQTDYGAQNASSAPSSSNKSSESKDSETKASGSTDTAAKCSSSCLCH